MRVLGYAFSPALCLFCHFECMLDSVSLMFLEGKGYSNSMPVVMIKYSDKKQLRGKGVYFSLQFQVTVRCCGEVQKDLPLIPSSPHQGQRGTNANRLTRSLACAHLP